ncbi:MAG: NmrA family NAD(P)-binding protein, partial [Bacteroidales bacterium]|nr:NmrA family NAD(P)-binding protein [Bacteroidales bacterium]
MNKKNVAVIGSTGSIGRQTLDIIAQHPDKFSAEVLTANTQADLLIEQALKFNPNVVVIADKTQYAKVKEALSQTDIKVFAGKESIDDVVQMDCVDVVLMALVGFAGLSPTIKAIEKGKLIALANKETLVVAGEYVMSLAKQNNTAILPVDSEHSAIFQCLIGEINNEINKIYLTASGGPFRNLNAEELSKVSVAQALNHPNWAMGKKVTI